MKARNSFFGRLMLSHIIVILISLTVLGLIFGYLVQHYLFGLKEWRLTTDGHRIAKLVSENISGGNLYLTITEKNKEKIKTISQTSKMNIALINLQGKFVFKSNSINDTHLLIDQNEITSILKGNSLSKKILGPVNKYLLMVFPLYDLENKIDFIIEPVIPEEAIIIGGIILKAPLDGLPTTINDIIHFILYAFFIALLAAIIISIPFARRVTRPVEAIQDSALDMLEGKFKKVSLPENSSNEIIHLVKTYNYAVDQIDETLHKKETLEKRQKEFVANVSHEFRAPLTSIKGFLELFLEQDLAEEDIRNYAHIMHKDTIYLEHMIADLLSLSRLDSNNVPLNKEELKPEKIVKNVITLLQNSVREKDIVLKTFIAEDTWNIYADKNTLYHVLINLLDNAIYFSPPAAVITITAKNILEDQQKAVKFSVSDQGPGIQEEELDKIWQRFYKVNHARTREKKGSGLGLAIVKEIIQQHGGRLEVKSVPEEGSTFSFIIYV